MMSIVWENSELSQDIHTSTCTCSTCTYLVYFSVPWVERFCCIHVHILECVCVPMYREELAASTSNAADDKKVDILLQRDQTISEVCLRLHIGVSRGRAWRGRGAILPLSPFP